MAKVVPSGVIQLPDFAQLDYNLKQQKRQEQLQFDDYLSRFGEIQGNYLAGDLEAVQGAYDNIESIMDKLAANPDDPSLRRELRNAYGNYSQLAGTAKFLADNNRQQRALYATNPDNFSLTSDEAMGMLDDDARTKRSSEQILGLAGSPLTLPLAYKYQLGSPTEVADEMRNDFERIKTDYLLNDGTYNQDGITQWANEWLGARYIDPEQKRNAVAYSALRQGKIGRNGKLTGREDLDRLDTPEFEPFRDPLLGDYTNQTVEAFMKTVPKRGIDVITMRDKAEERAYKQALIDLKKTNQFSNLNIRNMSGTTPISVKYVPETAPDPQDPTIGIVHDPTEKKSGEFTAQTVIDLPKELQATVVETETGDQPTIVKVMYDLEGTPYFLTKYDQVDISGDKKTVFKPVLATDEYLNQFDRKDRAVLSGILNPEVSTNEDPLGIL
jgi:hypothetical protein